MTTLQRRFGVAVRGLRETRGWSQEHLAGLAELNRSYLGEVERGDATPSLATIDKLARALQVSAADLLQRCDTSPCSTTGLDPVPA